MFNTTQKVRLKDGSNRQCKMHYVRLKSSKKSPNSMFH